jgi:hypothetical protein
MKKDKLAAFVRDFFTRQPHPNTAFQLSARYLCGLHLTPKEKKISSHFILPLEEGVLEPSFYKKNISDPAQLGKELLAGARLLSRPDRSVVFLLPELSQKIFILSFDTLPFSPEEREELILFRVKKQMPLLPPDSRLAYEVLPSQEKFRVVASVAKAAVVQEYEEVFHRRKFKVTVTGVPSMSLINLLGRDSQDSFILIDVEQEAFSLMAGVKGEVALYRQKPFGFEVGENGGPAAKARNIVQEITNTQHFIEDKEKIRIASLWVRVGILGQENGLYENLRERLDSPLQRIESCFPQGANLNTEEKRILSPLIGQLR